MNNLLFKSSVALYAIVNGIFVYKYGVRQEVISPVTLLVLYIFFAVGFIFLSEKVTLSEVNSKFFSRLYWILVTASVVVYTFIIFKVDGESLNVDRWSALELTVKGILDGVYPYTQLDHLGKMSSNFPALGFLALPFYLLGDVGYLQVFMFLLFAFYLYKRSRSIKNSFFVLALFVLSPALLWEVYAKSDLTSNILLVVLFADWWSARYRSNVFQKPVFLGVLMAFLLLTRGIVLIPLIIFFLKDFVQSDFNTKVKFIITVVLTALLICMPIILSAPNWNLLIEYNPLTLQTNKAPAFSYLFLLIPFVIPYLTDKYKNYQFYAAVLILAIPFTGFLNSIVQVGWNQTIFEHKYDISYLSMCLPPLLIWFKNHADNASHKVAISDKALFHKAVKS